MATKREINALVKKIELYVRELQVILGLDHFAVKNVFSESLDPEDSKAEAYCHVLWEYEEVTYTWIMPQLLGKPDEYLLSVVLHEMAHTLIDPIGCWHMEKSTEVLVEMVATKVAKAIQRALSDE